MLLNSTVVIRCLGGIVSDAGIAVVVYKASLSGLVVAMSMPMVAWRAKVISIANLSWLLVAKPMTMPMSVVMTMDMAMAVAMAMSITLIAVTMITMSMRRMRVMHLLISLPGRILGIVLRPELVQIVTSMRMMAIVTVFMMAVSIGQGCD